MSDICNTNDILDLAKQVEYEDFPIPGSTKVIRLRNMSGAQRRQWEAQTFDYKTSKPRDIDIRACLIAFCACDQEFKPLFTDRDIQKISELPMKILEPMFAAASRINGIGNQGELEKNLGSDPEKSSSSG